MANIDNECKDLKVIDYHKDIMDNENLEVDTLGDIMAHQKRMQEETYKVNFDNMSIEEIKDFWLVNMHSLKDELHEMMDALGGIKDGDGNAVWKYWKKDHKKYKDLKISDLSEGDRKELFMEWIDGLHFFINFASSIGLDSKTVYNYYFAKAEENKNRQKNGY
jgi:hypothetical protein